jgi:hypothetical protein
MRFLQQTTAGSKKWSEAKTGGGGAVVQFECKNYKP